MRGIIAWLAATSGVWIPLLIFAAIGVCIAAHRWRRRRLAWLAARRRADGSRGLLARRALRILVGMAGQSGPGTTDRAAVEALRWLGGEGRNEAGWQRWLTNPTDRGWASLAMRLERPGPGGRAAWRSSPASAQSLQRLFAEAVTPSRDAQARRRLGQFCARHGLAPQGPAERALFFLLTGQLAHYRAEDPDRSLVATAYQGAGEAMRAAVREAALAAGDLDVLRVLAQRPQVAAELSGEQTGRLARELAGRDEWARLWRLALDATLEQALAVAPLLAGWQPPGETGLRLLGLLQDAEPGLVAAVRAPERVRPAVALPALQVITSVSFAPDLSQVAVGSAAADQRTAFLGEGLQAAVEVFALPGGLPVWRSASARWFTRSVLHLGDVVVASEECRDTRGQRLMPWQCRLVSCQGRRRKRLRATWGWRAAWAWQLAPSGAGLVAVHPLGGEVLAGSGRRRALSRTWARLGGMTQRGGEVRLGTDPSSGRIALTSDTGLVIMDSAGHILATSDPPPTDQSSRDAAPVFCGPDTLITAGPGGLRLWRLDSGDARAGTLEEVAWQRLEDGDDRLALVVLPAARLVGCRRGDGQVMWFEAAGLTPAAAPPGMPDGPVDGLWASPGGEYLAVAAGGLVRVCQPCPDAAASLLARPMATLGTADLTAAAELERTDPDPATRQAMGLLRSCLEYRIGSEVALDDAAALDAAGADDVGLIG